MAIINRSPLSFDRFDNDRLTHAMTRILGLGWDKKSSGQTKTIQFLCSLQLFQSRMKLSWRRLILSKCGPQMNRHEQKIESNLANISKRRSRLRTVHNHLFEKPTFRQLVACLSHPAGFGGSTLSTIHSGPSLRAEAETFCALQISRCNECNVIGSWQ